MILPLLVILTSSLTLYANTSQLFTNLGPTAFEGNRSATDQKICSGDIGPIQNDVISVTGGLLVIMYNAPDGYESCDIDYETIFELGDNGALLQKTTNKNLTQLYDYYENRVLCKTVIISVTPIYNGIKGETYRTGGSGLANFNPRLPPPRSLSVDTSNSLYAKWISPIDCYTCNVVYYVNIIDIYGNTLDSGSITGYEWYYDNGANGIYCADVFVKVRPTFRGYAGEEVSVQVQLGPPSGGSC